MADGPHALQQRDHDNRSIPHPSFLKDGESFCVGVYTLFTRSGLRFWQTGGNCESAAVRIMKMLKSPLQSRVSTIAVVIALTGVLAVLGVLQYRWSLEASEATSMRMQANLKTSLAGFRQDLHRELSAVCLALQVAPDVAGSSRWSEYARRYQEWSRTAAHPDLVTAMYLWNRNGEQKLLRLDPATGELRATEWPASLQPLREGMPFFSTTTPKLERRG